MAIIRAFEGVRPDEAEVEFIAALPYDVYNRTEAKAIVKKNPKSFLKIDRAETMLPDEVDTYDPLVYEKAKELFNEMLNNGQFIQDASKSLYIYRLTMDGRDQTGLVACTSIDDYMNNHIKKHELTRATKEQDRINHVDALDANTGPIFMAYRAKKEIDRVIESWMNDNVPVYDFTADTGVQHSFWKISNQQVIDLLIDLFQEVESLYIADGHHRAASAVKVGLKRREENSNYSGEEPFNYFLSVLFPDNQLKILDYNRAVKDLDGLTKEQFLENIRQYFDIEFIRKEAIKPSEKGTFGMYLEDEWYLLRAKEGSFHKDDPVLGLDVSILQLNLLAPILGVGDPRTDDRIDFIGGIRGLQELELRCHKDMKVAFALVPTSIEELMSIADAGELMPPKSTWFEPKLLSGLIAHLLH